MIRHDGPHSEAGADSENSVGEVIELQFPVARLNWTENRWKILSGGRGLALALVDMTIYMFGMIQNVYSFR